MAEKSAAVQPAQSSGWMPAAANSQGRLSARARAERELAGSFYVNLDQGMDLKTFIEAQKAGREVLDKLGQIKAELAAMQQEFTNEKECGQDQTSGMSMEL